MSERRLSNGKKLKFKLVYCTGEEGEYPVTELENHSPNTKGWQSSRFCEYPQILVLDFGQADTVLNQLQFLSHQSKIATRVELFCGDGDDYRTARFRRLGFLSLDSNERSAYKARELKSVFIDTRGRFLKMLLHKCYVNKFNLFNQVGVVALNVLGDVPNRYSEGISQYSDSKQSDSIIPPMSGQEEFAVDMKLDAITASRLKQLREEKRSAVASEDYEEAKRLKLEEQRLLQVGVKIAHLEMKKYKAVQSEDYGLAREIKNNIDMLRTSCRSTTVEESKHIREEAVMNNSATRQIEQTNYEQKSRPTKVNIKYGKTNKEKEYLPLNQMGLQNVGGANNSRQIMDLNSNAFEPTQRSNGDERPLDVARRGASESMPTEYPTRTTHNLGNESGKPWEGVGPHPLAGVPGWEELPIPESLGTDNADIQRQHRCKTLTNVFGDYVTRCLLSRLWILREAALNRVASEVVSTSTTNEAVDIYNAFVEAISMTANDHIGQVFMGTIDLVEVMLSAPHMIGSGVSTNIAVNGFKVIVDALVAKLGNNNVRLRERSKSVLTNLARDERLNAQFVAKALLRTLTTREKGRLWRGLLYRLTLLCELCTVFQCDPSQGFGAKDVMQFLVDCEALQHKQSEIRDVSLDVLLVCYKNAGDAVVRPYMRVLNDHPKRLQIINAALARVEPNNHGSDNNRRDSDSMGRSSRGGRGGGRNRGKKRGDFGGDNQSSSSHTDERNINSDQVPANTCAFCGRYDESWGEKQLDMHYWQECPMLISCPKCQQVVEISSLNDHLLGECSEAGDCQRCTICGEAIAIQYFDSHMERASCKPTIKGAQRCPLCHTDVVGGEAGWRRHIMEEGCPANDRQVK